jgi:ABC-type transport system involved in multi-copper enzyme maturation permease subunit
MTFLPIVDRELRVAARLTSTYKKRALAAALVAVVAMAMMLFGTITPSPAQVGGAMFGTLSWMMLAFCLLEGVRKTSDCLSEERREGTLGLLFLTDLKGYDVILGKLAATSLTSIYGLLAMLPILALSLLLGGVTQGEFWRRALALANLLFFSLSAGMWVSARSRSERRAMVGTLWVVLLFLAVPPLTGASVLSRLSPGYCFFHAPEALYRSTPRGYWESLLSTQCVSWFLLVWASFSVARLRPDEVVVTVNRSRWRERRHRFEFGDAPRRAKLRAQMLDINPALWLAGRNAGQRLFLWIFIAVVSVASVIALSVAGAESFTVLIPLFFIINFLMKTRLASQACHCLAEARRNNALEMLLSTPITVPEVLRGQILALKRTFQLPIIIIFVVEIIVCLGGIFLFAATGQKHGYISAGLFLVGMSAYLGMFLLDLWAVTWAGMWFGLSSRNETQATFKTILYVLVLPCFMGILYCFGIPLFIASSVIWALWARQKVQMEFRTLAGQRFDPNPPASGWWFFQKSKYIRLPPHIPAVIQVPESTLINPAPGEKK